MDLTPKPALAEMNEQDKDRPGMPGIDETIPFKPVNLALLTASDTRELADDKSGGLLAERVEAAGHVIADRAVVRDETGIIRTTVQRWIADPRIDVVITTGGTGLTGRDVTPEAIRPLFDKEIDGFSVLMHMLSFEKVGTSTIQSRALAGVAGGTYIFCLPGSPGACKDAWDGILQYQLDYRHRPCNFVEIMPRLNER
jgi:molybdenum cofactor biosynthesis protein B